MRPLAIASTILAAAVLAACAKPEPSAYVPGQPMTFPMKSAGTLEAVGARLIQACRDRGDMNDPDCALRIKRRLDSCVRQMPGVFDTEAIYNQYTRAYEKCLLTAK
jgi:hypothetical protein